MAVWLLHFWCLGDVPDTDIKPNTKWFPSHISASVPPEWSNRDPVTYPTLSKVEATTAVSQKSSCSELFDMQVLYILFDTLWFHLQSLQDGIFGEWLFFLWLNNTHSSPSITHGNTLHTPSSALQFLQTRTADASRHGKGCWWRGLSRGIWKRF